jgi:hypothetical protein
VIVKCFFASFTGGLFNGALGQRLDRNSIYPDGSPEATLLKEVVSSIPLSLRRGVFTFVESAVDDVEVADLEDVSESIL